MRRTVARLADGREIIYYDRAASAAREVADRRPLADTGDGSQMRYDAVLEEWVSMASHRQDRTHLPPADQCPLCPSVGGRRTEIPSPDYDVVVFQNRFPSFAPGPPVDVPVGPGALSEPRFVSRPSVGRCEVVCFTSRHDSSFAELGEQQARLVVDTWADRTVELSRLTNVRQVFCFENRGEAIGVTLNHPHGQIYAYPFITPRTRRMLAAAGAHRDRTGGNLFADTLRMERADGSRVVTRGAHWTAFVPFAARWPVELHLYPHRHVPDLAALGDDERDDLARVYLDLLQRLDRLYDSPLPYIAAWHQAPVRADGTSDQSLESLAYLHLQLFSIQRAPGKLKYLAGSESAMGVFVNDVVPEAVAARLREIR